MYSLNKIEFIFLLYNYKSWQKRALLIKTILMLLRYYKTFKKDYIDFYCVIQMIFIIVMVD